MATTMPAKDPADDLDYGIDWTYELALVDDTIASSAWTVTSGITKGTDTHTTTGTTVWVSGGTAGQTYEATNTVTTAGGRTYERSLRIPVINL